MHAEFITRRQALKSLGLGVAALGRSCSARAMGFRDPNTRYPEATLRGGWKRLAEAYSGSSRGMRYSGTLAGVDLAPGPSMWLLPKAPWC